MNYIVFDLEYNQHEDPNRKTRLHFEIMQIGAVKCDSNFKTLSVFEQKVRPKCINHVRKDICKLTGITDNQLKNGQNFPAVLRDFLEWCGDESAFVTWGPDDEKVLRENMRYHGLSQKKLPSFCDVQKIFSYYYMNSDRIFSLMNAIAEIGEKGYVAHDALNDALNTAAVCRHMELGKLLSAAEEDELLNKTLWESMTGRERMFYRVAQNKDVAAATGEISTFRCPICKTTVICKEWIPHNQKRYAIAKCDAGDEFFIRLKFFPNKDGRYTVKRSVYDMNDELKERYSLMYGKYAEHLRLEQMYIAKFSEEERIRI